VSHHAHFAEQLRHLWIGVVRCSEAADALRIASTFDMIDIDRAFHIKSGQT
jgi:hypothetical protein